MMHCCSLVIAFHLHMASCMTYGVIAAFKDLSLL